MMPPGFSMHVFYQVFEKSFSFYGSVDGFISYSGEIHTLCNKIDHEVGGRNTLNKNKKSNVPSMTTTGSTDIFSIDSSPSVFKRKNTNEY